MGTQLVVVVVHLLPHALRLDLLLSLHTHGLPLLHCLQHQLHLLHSEGHLKVTVYGL